MYVVDATLYFKRGGACMSTKKNDKSKAVKSKSTKDFEIVDGPNFFQLSMALVFCCVGGGQADIRMSLNPVAPIQVLEIYGLEKDKSSLLGNNQVIIKGVCKRTNEKKKRLFVAFYNPNTRKGKIKII